MVRAVQDRTGDRSRRGREAAPRTGEGRERPVTPAKIMKISKIALVAIKFVQFKMSTAGDFFIFYYIFAGGMTPP